MILELRLKLDPWLPIMNTFQHNCARWYEWTIAPLETGVECTADVVCKQEPPRERGGCGISHSACEIRKRTRVWTAIQKWSGLVVAERADVSRAAHEDVNVSAVRGSGEKITRIVNVYDQRDTVRRETGT
jgi:hypothetical protein